MTRFANRHFRMLYLEELDPATAPWHPIATQHEAVVVETGECTVALRRSRGCHSGGPSNITGLLLAGTIR
jgi:hypothetical protein